MIDYTLYLVTDDPSRYAGDWIENVLAAVQGGVTCVQYRDTESTSAEQYARAKRLKDALATTHTPLIINNDADLAAALAAEGLHVGQSDLPPKRAREIVGPKCEIGLSLTSLADLNHLDAEADAFGIGPVFDARKTKADAAAAMGVEGLRAILDAAPRKPAVAIGGITLENAAEVLQTGVNGLAVVSAFSKAQDPFLAARSFRALYK